MDGMLVRFRLAGTISEGLLSIRPEHFSCDSRDQSTWDQTLRLGSEVIPEAGDHIALSGGQRLQTGAGDFFGSFRLLTGELFLPRDRVKFRFR